MNFVERLKEQPIAVLTEKANEQHYEVPAVFFEKILGRHLKYSSGYWWSDTRTLDEAEAAMLQLTAERAELADGMEILELGCGWGSLTLWMAERYPAARIVGVTNSDSQRDFIIQRARDRNLKNIEVVTSDMNNFSTGDRFDRVVSVEMLEHMRNYEKLLSRISTWLKPGSKLFVHIFTHRKYAYFFQKEGDTNWIGQHFFSGGTMPSDHLLLYFQHNLVIEQHWRCSGRHYQNTAEAWATNMDKNKESLLAILREVYGKGNEHLWFRRWKTFFLACSEMFGFNRGEEWLVSHYRFVR
jgi:cyclopropane-fatty-acyl-phospholipid synthase